MLQKFMRVVNVGRFINYKPTGDVTFRKVTLIYGENGRGKSTITSIIRSLQTSDGHHIGERASVLGKGTPQVECRFANGNITFTNGSWNVAHPDIEIFDAHFVDANVYSGFTVDHDHKRNIYRLIVGEKGVSLSKAVDDLDEKIRKEGSSINAKKVELKPYIQGMMDVDTFAMLKIDPTIDSLIAAKEEEIAKLSNADEILKKSKFSELAVPIEPDISILTRTLDDLSAEAVEAVATHRQTHKMKGEQWLEQGLQMLQEVCPFCARPVTGIELVDAYRAYFGKSYKALKSEIQGKIDSTQLEFGPTAVVTLKGTIKSNDGLTEFWQHYFDVGLPSLEPHTETMAELHKHLALKLAEKAGRPLDAISAGTEANAALVVYRDMLRKVAEYNAVCRDLNVKVEAAKAETAGGDLEVAKGDLTRLKNIKRRAETDVDQICTDYLSAKLLKKKFETDKVTAKDALDAYSDAIFSQYEKKMNDHLLHFGAEFKLLRTKSSYVGGKPNSSYEIDIDSVAIELDAPVGRPCFKTALSVGDKSCLGLAFFLTSLDHDLRIKDKIVVLDDPMCSMDHFRQRRTVKAIIELSAKAKQVVVLSHDPHFLRAIWDQLPQGDVKPLKVDRQNTNESQMIEWDIEHETQSVYLKDYAALKDYIQSGSASDLVDVARKIRPLIEGNLRFRFPDSFKPKEWLADFITAIRQSQTGDPLHHLNGSLKELTDINDFSKEFHHTSSNGLPRDTVTDAELKIYVQQTLNFLRK